MKKIMTLALALAFVTPMEANASCGAGQSSGVEVNATTKVVTYYCFTPEPVKVPTQQEIETKVQESVSKTITEQKNANAPTQVAEVEVSAEPEPITEPLTKIEVNATTGEVKVLPLNEVEVAEVVKARTASKARQKAQQEAQKLAVENRGTKYCVNWAAQGRTGSECEFDPIPATQEEVTEQYDFLKDLMAFDWSGFLNLWKWRW